MDNARFVAERRRLAPRRDALKAAFGIAAQRRVVLFCARFVAKKQPLMLVDAFLDAALGDGWVLLMVGDGPLRRACAARAAERNAGEHMVFTGFLDQTEVARAYAVAEVMVLPSSGSETWGLVVNEAMNFGCLPIVSDRVGCAQIWSPASAGSSSPTTGPMPCAPRCAGCAATRRSAPAFAKGRGP